ncbi:hypothetical protein ACM25O_20295 [Sulfitobacter pontiacus]
MASLLFDVAALQIIATHFSLTNAQANRIAGMFVSARNLYAA